MKYLDDRIVDDIVEQAVRSYNRQKATAEDRGPSYGR